MDRLEKQIRDACTKLQNIGVRIVSGVDNLTIDGGIYLPEIESGKGIWGITKNETCPLGATIVGMRVSNPESDYAVDDIARVLQTSAHWIADFVDTLDTGKAVRGEIHAQNLAHVLAIELRDHGRILPS